MTDAIQNGEVGSSVRAKLNENFVDVSALKAEAALSFDTVAALLADSTLTYVTAPAGSIVEAGGFRYEVAASAATDQHVSTAGGVKLYVQKEASGYDVTAFGAVGDGTTDDTAIIQSAIDAVSAAGGGQIWFPSGVYGVSDVTGAITLSRRAALRLKSGVVLAGVGAGLSLIRRLGTDMAFDLVQAEGAGTFPSVTQTMGVRGITLDGSSQNRVDGEAGTGDNGDGFNLWLFNVRAPVAQDLVSINSASWGVRLERCIGGTDVGNIRTEHGADVNADGVHFVDCRDMSCSGFEISTKGDDGFIVEAKSFDIRNLHLTGVTVRCPLEVTAAGRGVLVFRETLGGTLTTTLNMDNIKIEAVTQNCGGANNAGAGLAVVVEAATLRNSVFDIQSDACTRGMIVRAGTDTLSGVIENCIFRLVDRNAVATPTQFSVGAAAGSRIESNRCEIMQFNPADGQSGVILRGDRWTGYINVDYNPNGTKVSPGSAVNVLTANSSLAITARGSDKNINLLNETQNTTISLGALSGAVTRDIEINGTAVDTIFVGGSVTGSVTGATAATRFLGTEGVNNTVFVGDFGVGASTLDLITDWDNIALATGWYGTNSSTSSGTAPGGYTGGNLNGVVNFVSYSSGNKVQTFVSFGASPPTMWFRRYSGGAWGNWFRNQTITTSTTAARPTVGLVAGLEHFDTTLNKPIWRDSVNSGWIDATGATV